MPKCGACPETVSIEDKKCPRCGAPLDVPMYGFLENRLTAEEEVLALPPQWIRIALSLGTIGGSSIGLFLGLSSVFTQPFKFWGLALTLAFVVALACAVWCGVLLMQGRRGWLRKNQVLWAAQIPIFSSPPLGFLFQVGPSLLLYFQVAPWAGGINGSFGGKFWFNFSGPAPWQLGINFAAVAIYIYLARIAKMASNPSFQRTASGGR